MPPRRASSGLYDNLDVVTKNFPVTLGACLFGLALVKKIIKCGQDLIISNIFISFCTFMHLRLWVAP